MFGKENFIDVVKIFFILKMFYFICFMYIYLVVIVMFCIMGIDGKFIKCIIYCIDVVRVF